jgi:Ca-activated chloride channel family protein
MLTDGENNSGRVTPLTAAEAAKALGIKVYTIGAGSRGLVPYPMTDNVGRIRGYQQVQAEFDEETLKQIASMTGASYYRATDTKSLESIFDEIDQLEKSQVEVQKVAQYKDLFPWFVLVGTVLLAAETLLGQTIWRRLP